MISLRLMNEDGTLPETKEQAKEVIARWTEDDDPVSLKPEPFRLDGAWYAEMILPGHED